MLMREDYIGRIKGRMRASVDDRGPWPNLETAPIRPLQPPHNDEEEPSRR